jgi:hypothetical protein
MVKSPASLKPLLCRSRWSFSVSPYLSLALIGNPLDPWSLIFFVLPGIGQISAFLGSQSFIGQEPQKEARGSVIGAFNISGAIGILFITSTGGRLFDGMSPKAPFLIVGAVNLLVMLGGMVAASAGSERGMRRVGAVLVPALSC